MNLGVDNKHYYLIFPQPSKKVIKDKETETKKVSNCLGLLGLAAHWGEWSGDTAAMPRSKSPRVVQPMTWGVGELGHFHQRGPPLMGRSAPGLPDRQGLCRVCTVRGLRAFPPVPLPLFSWLFVPNKPFECPPPSRLPQMVTDPRQSDHPWSWEDTPYRTTSPSCSVILRGAGWWAGMGCQACTAYQTPLKNIGNCSKLILSPTLGLHRRFLE